MQRQRRAVTGAYCSSAIASGTSDGDPRFAGHFALCG